MSDRIDPDLMRPIGWALVHFLWQGALIAAVVALVSLAVKKAAGRYLLFCSGLALMAISPIVTALWIHQDSIQPLDFVLAPSIGIGGEEPWIPWLTGAWVVGVSFCILRLIAGCFQVQKLKKAAADRLPAEWAERVQVLSGKVGVGRRVRMLIVDRLDTPATIGTVRALILMPASALTRLSSAQLEALIAHELAHIKRYDYLVNLVQSFIEAVLFYHPAVWWISKQIRNEREHCCDDIAVDAVGDALVYARALERLETLRTAPAPSLAMAVNGGSVYDRIRRLVGLPSKGKSTVLATPFVALALGAATLVGVSAKAATSRTEDSLPTSGPTSRFFIPAGPTLFGLSSPPAKLGLPLAMPSLSAHPERQIHVVSIPRQSTPVFGGVRLVKVAGAKREESVVIRHTSVTTEEQVRDSRNEEPAGYTLELSNIKPDYIDLKVAASTPEEYPVQNLTQSEGPASKDGGKRIVFTLNGTPRMSPESADKLRVEEALKFANTYHVTAVYTEDWAKTSLQLAKMQKAVAIQLADNLKELPAALKRTTGSVNLAFKTRLDSARIEANDALLNSRRISQTHYISEKQLQDWVKTQEVYLRTVQNLEWKKADGIVVTGTQSLVGKGKSHPFAKFKSGTVELSGFGQKPASIPTDPEISVTTVKG